MWLLSSTFAATVWRCPPTPMTTIGRTLLRFELPDRTRILLLIGPAPTSAARLVSMLVRVAPVSDLATTVLESLVPLTITSSVYPIDAASPGTSGEGCG